MVTVRNSVVGHRTGDWFVRDVPTVADSLFLVTQSLIHKFHIFCGKDDIARFSNENVVASMNPHHAVTTFHNYLTERIGP